LSKLFLFSGNLICESKEEEEVLLPHLHKRSEEEEEEEEETSLNLKLDSSVKRCQYQ
jgi:hypothetical protein